MQRQAAERLCVSVENVRNWEWNKTKPEVRFLPALLDFVGYDPGESPTSLSRALRKARRSAGLSQRELAKRAGFDQSSIALWEAGGKMPLPANVNRLRQFFQGVGQALPDFVEEAGYSSARRSEAARRGYATRRRVGQSSDSGKPKPNAPAGDSSPS